MKLYAFQPNGHGPKSFFVCAASQEEAKKAVDDYINKHLGKDDDEYITEYSIKGWGTDRSSGGRETDYYHLTELAPGEVIYNCND